MSVSYSNDFPPRASFASWRRDGEPPRYVPATTMCVSPRLPHRLRARREGFETTIRCGDCPGCREFEVLRLERRLVETYRSIDNSSLITSSESLTVRPSRNTDMTPRLFAVRVYCPREKHASMSRRIHRWCGVEVERGFFRAGVESFVVLSREPRELVARLQRRRFRLDVRPIGKLNRARSWRYVARGLIVARSAYGEHINRFYRRGLAAAEKEHFEVHKINEYHSFDRNRDPRAVSERLGNLVPPEVLEVRRGLRLRMRNAFRYATTPEKVDSIMPEVLALVRRIDKPLVVSAVPKTTEELARSRRAYEHVARLESARTADPIDLNSSPPSFSGGVTELLDNSRSFEERTKARAEAMMRAPPAAASSIQEEAAAAEASEKHRSEFLAQRSNKKLHEAIERLRALADKFGR